MKLLIRPKLSFTNEKYPCFIRTHSYLKTNPKIQKVFPLIGLPNVSYPIKGSKNRVVFSSDPWDIATMSMRGVSSCQKWPDRDLEKRFVWRSVNGIFRAYFDRWVPVDPRHAGALIGSIVDPCCAIIYLTDGTNRKLGEKMLARAVIRFVFNNKTHKPVLFMDTIYGKESSRADLLARFKKLYPRTIANPNGRYGNTDRLGIDNLSIPRSPVLSKAKGQ